MPDSGYIRVSQRVSLKELTERLTREVAKRASDTQQQTVAQLNALGTYSNGWTIDAGALVVVASQGCANDTGHGPGTCVFPDTDGLCLSCTERYLKMNMDAGQRIAIDVLL